MLSVVDIQRSKLTFSGLREKKGCTTLIPKVVEFKSLFHLFKFGYICHYHDFVAIFRRYSTRLLFDTS